MSTPKGSAVSGGQRALAWLSIGCAVVLTVVLVVFSVRNLAALAVVVVGVAVAGAGAWWLITERPPRRWVGLGGAVAGLVIVVAAVVAAADGDWPLVRAALVLLLAVVTIGSARLAMVRHLHAEDALRPHDVTRPRHPVLICNPWSGGGKVKQFGLVELANELGVETVMLDHGLDLEQLARDAIARGADCLGMAGGDGSQALVASIAVECGVPFVVVTAGTRNHFAQDLGLDRDDPRLSVHAFRDGIERRIDYATVNDRFFVNNVSLGVYAALVQQDGYRDAKAETTKTMLPEVLGKTNEPFDLQFSEPDGTEVDGAFIIQVSNNPYALGSSIDAGQRRRIDTGELGVIALTGTTGKDAAGILALDAVGQRNRSRNWHEFTTAGFEVRSRSAPRSPASTARRSRWRPRWCSASFRADFVSSCPKATSTLRPNVVPATSACTTSSMSPRDDRDDVIAGVGARSSASVSPASFLQRWRPSLSLHNSRAVVPAVPREVTVKGIEHPTVEERTARGKAARDRANPSDHSGWSPADGRPDPVALLEEQDATREADLVPVRHGRMMVSPFTFYRGGAKIMAADLKDTPTSGLDVQLCGDAHLSNFGAFASPERTLLFDLNDFDETLPGPFEYDVKRMAASFTIAARNNGHSAAQARAASLASATAYREAMARFAEMGTMEVWYTRISAQDMIDHISTASRSLKGADKKLAKTVHKTATKSAERARTRDSTQALSKLAEVVDGRYRIISQPPVIVPLRDMPAIYGYSVDELEQMLRERFREYRASLRGDQRHLLERFEVIDMARKVVGVGSVGTRAFIILLQGRDAQDPLFLQVKEATNSVLEDHLPKSRFRQPGERVVQGQRLMQAASDIYLGWSKGAEENRYLYWRQLRDMKASAVVETMAPATLSAYARFCAETLARAHARSGDAVSIAAYLGKKDGFDQSLADFSQRYADQNDRDYAAFRDAISTGRLQAIEGA